jgi:aspartate/methionine/tyrosine aminotransferase
VAALGAFDGIDELEAIKASYARNRAMLLEELPRAGLSSVLPAAEPSISMPISAASPATAKPSPRPILKDIGVAVTPGVDFDPDRGRLLCGSRGADAEASAPHHRLAEREIGNARLARFLDL